VLDAAYQAHPERFVRSAPKSLGVAVLFVIPSEKVLAEDSGILDTAKFVREVRPVLRELSVSLHDAAQA
jgi:hypothetical protein